MPQQVERTGKGWKALSLVSLVCLLGGMGLFILSLGRRELIEQEQVTYAGRIAVYMILTGSGAYVFARLGAWWCHGPHPA